MTENKEIENIKQILQNTYVSFLLGAGASYNEVKGKKSYPLMKDLINELKRNKITQEYISYFNSQKDKAILVKNIVEQYLLCENANIELFLSVLEGADLYINDEEVKNELEKFQKYIKSFILNRIKDSDNETVLPIYEDFYKTLRSLKEQSSRKDQSFNVFSTNYDMLSEIAMENIGTHYYSGFFGIVNRKFNIAYYDSKFVDSYNVKNSSYIIDDNHINLYKLHGSISWISKNNELFEIDPYKVENSSPEIIYPSISKFNNTNLIAYYSALMREFSNKICKPNTTLVVCGTSLRDEHINKIIENALLINSFTMIVFCYGNEQIEEIKERYKNLSNVLVYSENATIRNITKIIGNVDENE